jgi:hypothetical protein
MTSIAEVSGRKFPADELLTLLGGSISRLVLLDTFSREQATRLSDGQFLDDNLLFFIKLAFAKNPVTEQFYLRPGLEEEILRQLTIVHPQVAADLADRMISTVIGSEVLDAQALVNWMLQHRWRSTVRAAIAGIATYSPFELIGSIAELEDRATVTPLLSDLMCPFSTTARRWRRALEQNNETSTDLRLLVALEHLSARTGESAVSARRSRAGQDVALRNGYLPVQAQIRPTRASSRRGINIMSNSHSSGTAVKNNGLSAGLGLRSLTDGREKSGTRQLSLSDSTRQLLQLVMTDRGPTQIIEATEIDFGAQLAQRTCTVSTSSSATVEGLLFVHLGSLPSSIGQSLPLTAQALGGDRLVSGAGPIVSRYLAEMTVAMSTLADEPDSWLSASDWSRIDRSIREPWRFVHTSLSYVDLSAVEVSWSEQLHQRKSGVEIWPFEGAAGSSCIIEGFRHGDDDNYTAKVSFADSREISAIELDAVPRPRDARALERPSRLIIHSTWSRPSLLVLLGLTLAAAIALFIMAGAAMVGQFLHIDYNVLSFALSAFTTVTSPVVAYITAASLSSERGHGTRRKNELTVRAGVVLLTAIVLITGTLFFSSIDSLNFLFSMLDILTGIYFIVATVYSLTVRKIQLRRILNELGRSSTLWEVAQSWNLASGWRRPSG